MGAPPASRTSVARPATSASSSGIATWAASSPRALAAGASLPRVRLVVLARFFVTAAFFTAMVSLSLSHRHNRREPRAEQWVLEAQSRDPPVVFLTHDGLLLQRPKRRLHGRHGDVVALGHVSRGHPLPPLA